MSKVTVHKNALTATHTKVVVLPNQACAPFIHGLKADSYKDIGIQEIPFSYPSFNDDQEDDYVDDYCEEEYSSARAEFEAAQLAAIDEEGY